MIDYERLKRALRLTVQSSSGGCYTVTGGRGVHTVDPQQRSCDCLDHRVRAGVVCKHRLAVQLAALDAELVAALRELAGASR